jgi:hypothetical protein
MITNTSQNPLETEKAEPTVTPPPSIVAAFAH